jgi:hypothetical protein
MRESPDLTGANRPRLPALHWLAGDLKPALILAALAVGAWFLFVSNRAPGTDAARGGYPLDDAWIHMVYARSLVEEGGFHYNEGVPEAGMTSPLWVVLLAGIHALAGGGPVERIVIGAKILALAFGIGGVVTLYRIARALGEGRAVAFFAASLAALDPSLTFSRAAGMEVPLFVFLVLIALLAALHGRPIATGVAAGLSVVARPEGIVLLPIFLLLNLRREFRTQPRFRFRLGIGVIATMIPIAGYMLLCLHATGAPLPNTFYAKFAGQNPFSLSLLGFGWRHYVHDNLPYFTLEAGSILAVLGAVRWFRRRRWVGLAPLACGGLLFVSALASRGFAPGHFYYWERWLIPAFPFLLLAIAAGAGELGEGLASLKGRRRRASPAPAFGALAAAAIVLAAWRLPLSLRERAATFAWNSQNIEEMNVYLGRWVAANLPPQAVVGVNDAGALRYFGMRSTVDLGGLNDHRLLGGNRREIMKMIENVDYFVVFPFAFEDLKRTRPLQPMFEVRAAHYTICDGPQEVMLVGRVERR